MLPPHRFRTEVAVSLLANDLSLMATIPLHYHVEEMHHNLKPGLELLVGLPRVPNPLLAPCSKDAPGIIATKSI